MTKRVPHMTHMTVAALTAAILLTACGGGGNSNDSPKTLISGTAASGAPLIGTVTVRDANNLQRTVTISTDGNYSIDVSGMTAPFLLRAQGSVGGRTTTLLSAATSSTDNRVNITPFSDLVIANIAGKAADEYFKNNPDMSLLTPDQLLAQRQALTDRLLPALTSIGVSASFDFLHSAFTPNHQGFDAVLDAIQVTVDPISNAAVIKDLINNTQITDDLTTTSDNSTLPTPVIPLGGASQDILAVQSLLETFANMYSGKTLPGITDPRWQTILANDGSFMDDGKNFNAYIEDMQDTGLLGLSFPQLALVKRISDTEMEVLVTVRFSDGTTESFKNYVKKLNGIWKLMGDQSPAEFNIQPVAFRNQVGFGDTGTNSNNYRRYLSIWIAADSNTATDIDYVKIDGPGIPDGGVYYHRSVQQVGFVPIDAEGREGVGSWLPECPETNSYNPCVNLAAVVDNSVYTFTFMNANKQAIHTPATKIVPKAPLPLATVQAHTADYFATYTGVTPTFDKLKNGSNLHISWTNPTDMTIAMANVFYWSNPRLDMDNEDMPPRPSAVDFTWSGPAPSSAPWMTIHMEDAYGRQYVTGFNQ